MTGVQVGSNMRGAAAIRIGAAPFPNIMKLHLTNGQLGSYGPEILRFS
jgi:hypothetical protein